MKQKGHFPYETFQSVLWSTSVNVSIGKERSLSFDIIHSVQLERMDGFCQSVRWEGKDTSSMLSDRKEWVASANLSV
jgi:hypothetical protein